MKKALTVVMIIILSIAVFLGLVACNKEKDDFVGIQSVTLTDDGKLLIIDEKGRIVYQGEPPKCNHRYSAPTMGLEASCAAAGYSYKTCLKCGYIDYTIHNATGHDRTNATIVLTPNCYECGLKHYVCSKCGETKTEIIPATDEHKYVDGRCLYCGKSYAEVLDGHYNGSYGYEYFASLQNGENLCALYEDLDAQVCAFHSDKNATAKESEGVYELFAIDWEEYGITFEEAISVWKTYLDDKPLYYWLAKSIKVNNEGKLAVAVDAEYADGATRAKLNDKLYAAIAEYKTLAQGCDAYYVALALHDEIIKSTDYAYDEEELPDNACWAHSIVGVFEGKGAVCEGYARAFQLLLNYRKIDNVFVTGQSMGRDHAWNLVRLDDGNWYGYDLTWDDTPNMYWGVSHDNACLNKEKLNDKHVADKSSTQGVHFLYKLPDVTEGFYYCDEIILNEKFSVDGIRYSVTGYDVVNVYSIANGASAVIPSKVTHKNREFTVVSLMNNANNASNSILNPYGEYKSVSIPSTVLYIDDNALSDNKNNNLEKITVDENNPRFRSKDGVLFTKSLYTLIAYPSSKRDTYYSIPDETEFIANNAFLISQDVGYLEELHLGKRLQGAGIANWGYGYPDEEQGGNIIAGEWNYILKNLTGAARVTVDEDNPYYRVRNDLLLDKEETCVYAALPNIENAVIPETVRWMDVSAFSRCSKLKTVKIPVGVTTLQQNLFGYCVNLTDATLPEGLTAIGDFAFNHCDSLKNIILPDSLVTLGSNAFSFCPSLEKVTIPANVTSINAQAFTYCGALREIAVDENNARYASKNGCLVETDSKTLIKGTADGVIPADGSVERIGKEAFEGYASIKSITIPNGITFIGDYAFASCENLASIVIPVSVTEIGSLFGTIYSCDVFYCGTKAEWDALFDENSIHERIKVYFYSEIIPNTDGNYWHYINGEPKSWR